MSALSLIPEVDFNQALEKSDFFRKYVFNNFSSRLSSVIHRMEEVVLNPLEVRLAKYLLSINEPVIRKTHQQLASEMGTVREVISRHLKQLKSAGWVALSRGKITVIDRIALEKLINNALNVTLSLNYLYCSSMIKLCFQTLALSANNYALRQDRSERLLNYISGERL